MPEEYSKDQLWKLYEKLPEELQEAIFSGESADNIDNICARNSIDNLTAEVAKYAGRVLMGILPPVDFQQTLEKVMETSLLGQALSGCLIVDGRYYLFLANGIFVGATDIESQQHGEEVFASFDFSCSSSYFSVHFVIDAS